MFRGVTHLNLDDKGRFAVPAKYRESLAGPNDGQLIMTVDLDRCLLLYPLHEWEKVERALMAQPNMNKMVRRLQRLIVGYASECELSAQGRLSVPPSLREITSLDKQITMVGQNNKFEIWDTATWQSQCDEWLNDDDLAELGEEVLGGFSL